MATVAQKPSNELFTLCSYYMLNSGGGGSAEPQEKKKKAPSAEDEDFDLFGTEDSGASAKAAQQLAQEKKKAAAAAAGGKQKKKVINKSMLVIEVKPAAADTNLDDVLEQVKNIRLEGLTWGKGFKKVPVAFGLYKLQVQCVIIDDLVNTNALVEMIEEIGMTEAQKKKKREKEGAGGKDEEDEEEEDVGLVQSAEIVSFNKL